MSEWRFDIENMPQIKGPKNIEVAYISKEGTPTTAIVGWDGVRYVTCRHDAKNMVLVPPPTIYAWKMADTPPPMPDDVRERTK